MTQPRTPSEWKECVRQRYPMLQQRAHFLPAVIMNRQVHATDTDSARGLTLHIPQPATDQHVAGSLRLMDSDVRDDQTQQMVLQCLHKIAEGETAGIPPQVLFVLSQLQFGDYLNAPCYSGAVAASGLARPGDVTMKQRQLEQGDFDVLILHRHYGLIAGEIKSVGSNAKQRGLSEQTVLKVLRKMLNMDKKKSKRVGQLQKAREVLTHVMQDIGPTVRSILILPHVSRALLSKAIDSDSDVKKALCVELGLAEQDDPRDLCLCSDHVTDDNQLGQFWSRVCQDGDQTMTDDVYEEIVARFAGPATEVRIFNPNNPSPQVTSLRTEGEFVSLAGERTATDVFSGSSLAPVCLYPDQLQIVNEANHEDRLCVHLAGPPGTGKTLVLVLAALCWLRHGLHVYILITLTNNTAVAYFIEHQLKETARRTIGPDAASRVHVLRVPFNEGEEKAARAIDQAVHQLTASASNNNGDVCLLADETSAEEIGLCQLYERLQGAPFKRVRLWSASYEDSALPGHSGLYQCPLTQPLRCPPSVTREVSQTKFIQEFQRIQNYTEYPAPPASEGPLVIRLEHKDHRGRSPTDCQQCGQNIARELTTRLHLGQGAGPQQLQYKDVFVLTHQDCPLDSVGVVLGLRRENIPVRVVDRQDHVALRDVATRQGSDDVIVTFAENVRGLERKVVVLLQGGEETIAIGRLNIASRCTSQLIWVM